MQTFKQMKKYGARIVAGGALAVVGTSAFAQATNPVVTMLEAVSLDGVAAALAAAGLVIVAIALTLKGPDVAKRIIRKV